MNRSPRPWREALTEIEVAEVARLDKVIEYHDDMRTHAARERHKIQCRASQRANQRAETRALHETRRP